MARWSYVVKFIAVGWIHFFSTAHTGDCDCCTLFCFWLKPRHFACALECTKTIPHGGEISSVDFPNVFIVSRIQDILSIFHLTRASWSIKRRFSRALGVVIKNNYFICEIHFCCLVSGDWKVRNPIIIGPRQSVNGFQQSKQRRRGDIVNCEEKNIDSSSSFSIYREKKRYRRVYCALRLRSKKKIYKLRFRRRRRVQADSDSVIYPSQATKNGHFAAICDIVVVAFVLVE